MELIPHDELRPAQQLNFAPMIDFLFLMLALFATLAMSRAALYDSSIELTQLKPEKGASSVRAKEIQLIHIKVSSTGEFQWQTEFQEYPMETVEKIQEELFSQYKIGALPQDKSKTEVLLHIDRRAPWESVAKVIFGIKELGFNARPVYEASDLN